jgi:hypothetical protein
MKKVVLPVVSLLLVSPLLGSAVAFAAPPAPKEESIIVTVHGTLTADGKPVTAASFYLQPSSSRTAVQVEKDGRFEVKAVATREYVVNIDAPGYAPVHQELELDAKGNGDLGAVKLETLRTARASVVVAPRGQLKAAAVQPVELRHGSCANVRAQDDSGCLLAFCVTQEGAVLHADRYSSGGQLRSLGAVSLADALGKLPKGGTFVTGIDDRRVPLVKGETLISEPADPYCSALVHVDDVAR